ncbi:HTH domain-containing protein [Terrilactibacillus sp. BCM23-1]|uniref:HTH domain-containing protein n=1 Tax=Terrilactibacillus tamarindi TaxID=2599694 RepID=A0A6N8CTN4_9BACI|nr:transcription repressor NadR [Terrilactibacillus tamarindi]MTT32423.1 HTH domain-containing protein [Terrilactibacillus tamarindi]
MRDHVKQNGSDRRAYLLRLLKSNREPITGSELAKRTNVSRQVIVQDISLLKAKNHPIIATSQGYLFLSQSDSTTKQRVIACQHQLEDTQKELNIMVDCGAVVKNVTIDHPIYGELTGSLMIKNRLEVAHFIEKLKETNAPLLSTLTEGVHLHLIEAPTEDILNTVCSALAEAGYLL